MQLREWLNTKKMPANEFAALIGVDKSTVGRWIAGDVRPSWEIIPRIIDATGGAVTANDFLPAPDDGEGPDAADGAAAAAITPTEAAA